MHRIQYATNDGKLFRRRKKTFPRPGHKDADSKEKKVCKKASEACKGISGDGPDRGDKNNPQDGVKEKAVMGI